MVIFYGFKLVNYQSVTWKWMNIVPGGCQRDAAAWLDASSGRADGLGGFLALLHMTTDLDLNQQKWWIYKKETEEDGDLTRDEYIVKQKLSYGFKFCVFLVSMTKTVVAKVC